MRPFHEWLSNMAGTIEDASTITNKTNNDKVPNKNEVFEAHKRIFNGALDCWRRQYSRDPETPEDANNFIQLFIGELLLYPITIDKTANLTMYRIMKVKFK